MMSMFVQSNAHPRDPEPYPIRALKIHEVEKMVGLKKSTIYKLMKLKEFPLNYKYPGSGASRWLHSEIVDWLQNLKH